MAAAAGVPPALLQLHPLPPLHISSSKRKTSRDLLVDIIKGYSHLTFMDKQFGEFERERKIEIRGLFAFFLKVPTPSQGG